MQLRAVAAVALVAIAATLSSASAQTSDPIGSVAGPLSGFVRDGQVWTYNGGGAQALTVAERARIAAGGGNLSRSLTVVGKRIGQYATRYGGVALIAGSVVYTALTYFYEQAQLSTGTPLDGWYHGVPEGAPVPTAPTTFTTNFTQMRAGNYSELGAYTTTLAPIEGCNNGGGSGCSVVAMYTNTTSGCGPRYRVSIFRIDGGGQEFFSTGIVCQVMTLAELHAVMVSQWAAFLASVHVASSLTDHLDGNPSSAAALGSQVVPEYLGNGASNSPATGNFPYTYGEPYGPGTGVTFDPAPNANQWHDNPYFDPSIDTDGDGWTDSEEATAGTDWMNPDDVPTVSPWPDPEPGEDPLPDADADGIPDASDPCPFHRYNSCAAVEQPEIEFPDDYARDATVAQVVDGVAQVEQETSRAADTLESIEDLLEADDGSVPVLSPLVLPEPDVSPLQAWLPDFAPVEAAWTSTLAQMETDVEALATTASTKFPFGFGTMLGSVPSFSGSECLTFSLELMDEVGQVDLCSTPLDGLLSTTGRSILAAVALLAFVWTSVQVVMRS